MGYGGWDSAAVPIMRGKVAVHHSVTRSSEVYEDKIRRSNGMGDTMGLNC